jgi:hypothetical protein
MRTYYGPIQRRLLDRALSSPKGMVYVATRGEMRSAKRLEARGIFKRIGPFSGLFEWEKR